LFAPLAPHLIWMFESDQERNTTSAIINFSQYNQVVPPAVAMAHSMSGEEKIALITSQLQETLKRDILEDVIIKQNRPLVIYWGMYST
jgi:hypothetical protein